MNLNDSQKRAVEHFDGPCLCLAGPGSGKTAVLTCRISRLIAKGVNPEKICVLTFTKAAANEMKERFMDMSNDYGQVVFGTFHSLFWGILCKEYGLKSDCILTGARRLSLLKEAMNRASVMPKDNDDILIYAREISCISSLCIKPEEYTSKDVDNGKLKKVYYNFQELKKKYKVYEFDDMLTSAYELFAENPSSLRNWQCRFSYFLIDEMQDMNELQYRLVKVLAVDANIFCVGDDDQSIYGFRGARPGLMQDFLKDYPDAKTIVLDNNYRCPENILKAALAVINNNDERLLKNLTANKAPGIIEINGIRDRKEEAASVVEKINKLASEGADFENMAVLYRNHSNAGYLVEALLEANIPFYLKEQMPNIYTHFIFEDFLDFFQIAIGNSTRARMLNIINKPNRYIMRQALEEGYSFEDIKAYYRGDVRMQLKVEALEKDINLISKMTPFAAANYIRQGIGYENFIRERSMERGQDADEMKDILDLFCQCVKDCKTISKAIDKISWLKLKVDYENKNRNNQRHGKVGLYTLHSSKGLEFENVFIIGANEGIMPSKRCVSKLETEAERRLFYVGVTRAKANLFISFAQYKNQDRLYPSRFISEMKIEDK